MMKRVVAAYLAFALLYLAAFAVVAVISDWGTGMAPCPETEDFVAVIGALAK
ncbi:MAG: hypothetical protein FWE41_07345 [Coriobacteriia bacterium]|nr:hypothetical protein [Coriobacteriia bacterium]MCL2749892.1 hypothetical protein [Coriobacteriia bacterium]